MTSAKLHIAIPPFDALVTNEFSPRRGVSYKFPKRLRLLRTSDFDRVFAARASAGDAWITLHAAANEADHPRLGLVVSRRVGNAVCRNRWKRLLRETFRLTQHELPALDLVCIARAATPPPLAELQTSLRQLASRLEQKISNQTNRPSKKTS